MLKAVRIEASQQMVNYRKPSSFIIKESYPLPPYSTVIGLTHNLCGWTGDNKGYRPMKVSIQGEYASTVSDYATNYTFGIKYDPTRHQAKVPAGNGEYDGVGIGPKNYELLTDVKLVLHIIPEDESLLEEICNAYKNPPLYPSLGRYEDLLRIEKVEIVELCDMIDLDVITTTMDIYIPVSSLDKEAENLKGSLYKIGKVFEYEGKKSKPMRKWSERVTVRHICKGVTIYPETEEKLFVDNLNGDIVAPA